MEGVVSLEGVVAVVDECELRGRDVVEVAVELSLAGGAEVNLQVSCDGLGTAGCFEGHAIDFGVVLEA